MLFKTTSRSSRVVGTASTFALRLRRKVAGMITDASAIGAVEHCPFLPLPAAIQRQNKFNEWPRDGQRGAPYCSSISRRKAPPLSPSAQTLRNSAVLAKPLVVGMWQVK